MAAHVRKNLQERGKAEQFLVVQTCLVSRNPKAVLASSPRVSFFNILVKAYILEK